MGAACSAIEPGLGGGAGEGVLEEANVLTRRSQVHRNLVEAGAGAHLVENASRDLDALATLSWRREQPHVATRLPLGRLLRRKEIAAQRRQIAFARRLQHLDASERPESIERVQIAERHGHERLRGPTDQALDEPEL